MPGDLYGFAVIVATLTALIASGTPGYRNHSDTTEHLLSLLLYVSATPVAVAFGAMFYGDLLLMMACLIAALGFGCAWLMATLSYFMLFA